MVKNCVALRRTVRERARHVQHKREASGRAFRVCAGAEGFVLGSRGRVAGQIHTDIAHSPGIA